MADYSKWDKLVDSDEEEKEKAARESRSEREEELEKFAELRDEVDRWLKLQVTRLHREENTGVPELCVHGIEPRWVGSEERATLAMFLAVVHFEKYDINVGRHHQIMNIARQNRWIEDDPGTLELLCRLHRRVMKGASEAGLSAQDKKMEDFLVSAVNTLAAPAIAGCSEGYGKIYEFFALIGDPKTDSAWDIRAKFMKKEYAADAMFNSLIPPAPAASGADDYGDAPLVRPGLCLILIVSLLGVILVLYLLYRRSGGAPPAEAPAPPPGTAGGEAEL